MVLLPVASGFASDFGRKIAGLLPVATGKPSFSKFQHVDFQNHIHLTMIFRIKGFSGLTGNIQWVGIFRSVQVQWQAICAGLSEQFFVSINWVVL